MPECGLTNERCQIVKEIGFKESLNLAPKFDKDAIFFLSGYLRTPWNDQSLHMLISLMNLYHALRSTV